MIWQPGFLGLGPQCQGLGSFQLSCIDQACTFEGREAKSWLTL